MKLINYLKEHHTYFINNHIIQESTLFQGKILITIAFDINMKELMNGFTSNKSYCNIRCA